MDFRVYVITDVAGADAAAALAPSGALAISLRDRAASGAAVFGAAERLMQRRHRVYINDRADVALAAGCEGVQLPRGGLGVADVRRLGSSLRVGVSVHALDEVAWAREQGADFCVLSPIFATPGKGPPLGLAALAEACRLGIPVVALGGVEPANARACFDAGARGVAAIRAGLALARALA